MTRWQRVVVTALALVGVLAVAAGVIATAALWPEWFFPLLFLVGIVASVTVILIAVARFIYNKLPRKD